MYIVSVIEEVSQCCNPEENDGANNETWNIHLEDNKDGNYGNYD